MADEPTNPPAPTPDPEPQPDPTPAPDPALASAIRTATEATRAALRTTHPNLPDTAFVGDTPEQLQANVTAAQEIADHALAQAREAGPGTPATNVQFGTTRQPEPLPASVFGTSRIGAALARGDKVNTASPGQEG